MDAWAMLVSSLPTYFSLSSRLLGKLSPQLLQHMAAGVLRSEVWLSVHVPKPNYSLISTQVVPTVHSHTHTHTRESLFSPVTHSSQTNKTQVINYNKHLSATDASYLGVWACHYSAQTSFQYLSVVSQALTKEASIVGVGHDRNLLDPRFPSFAEHLHITEVTGSAAS